MVTVQVALAPVHDPPHPLKYEFAAGTAVRVTREFSLKPALHTPPARQVMPEGLLVTVPWPSPPGWIVRVTGAAKVAVTLVSLVMVT